MCLPLRGGSRYPEVNLCEGTGSSSQEFSDDCLANASPTRSVFKQFGTDLASESPPGSADQRPRGRAPTSSVPNWAGRTWRVLLRDPPSQQLTTILNKFRVSRASIGCREGLKHIFAQLSGKRLPPKGKGTNIFEKIFLAIP